MRTVWVTTISSVKLKTASKATTTDTNRLASITAAAAAGIRALSYDARGNLANETRPLAVSAAISYDRNANPYAYAMNNRVHIVSALINHSGTRVQVPSGAAFPEQGVNSLDFATPLP